MGKDFSLVCPRHADFVLYAVGDFSPLTLVGLKSSTVSCLLSFSIEMLLTRPFVHVTSILDLVHFRRLLMCFIYLLFVCEFQWHDHDQQPRILLSNVLPMVNINNIQNPIRERKVPITPPKVLKMEE